MPTNPIKQTLRPSRHESSALRSPRDSSDQSRQWRKSRDDADQLGATQQGVQHMQRQLDAIKRRQFGPVNTEVYPFKILMSPENDAPADEDDLWRTFRVRGGRYGTTAVAGTDGGEQNADDLTIDPNPDYDPAIDFVVPSGTAAFYVWIDISDPDAPVIDTGATIPGSGTDAAWWGGDYILVATIDVDTNADTFDPIVDQYVRSHIPKCQ